MRRKRSNHLFAVLAAVVLCGTAAVSVSGAEFTDAPAGMAATGFEQAAFSDGEQLDEDGTVFEDGLEFQYIAETDSYKLAKGADRVSVYIPREIRGKMVTGIGENAFADCTTLRLVVVDGPVKVEKGAFVNCPRLHEFSVDCFPDKPKFAVGAFDADSKVVVTALGGIHSPELDEAGIFQVDIESSVIHYNEQRNLCYVDWDKQYVVDFDDSSEEVLVGKYMDVIRRRAFYGCNKLQEVVIANGLESIETKAFSDCKNLRKVIIPATVKEISSDAFVGSNKVVIYAPKGSYALDYAKEKGIAYKISDLEKIPRPVLRYAGRSGNRILLRWDKIPYADGYQLYRYDSETKEYERLVTLKNVDRLYYKTNLRPGRTEYYKVRAYSDTGIFSAQYSLLSKRVKVVAAPDRAEIRTVLAKYSNRLGIYWRKRENADGYLIYRSENDEYDGYKKVKYITDGSTTKYMDTGVKKGKTYYYKIQAYRMIDGKRVYGAMSEPFGATCK